MQTLLKIVKVKIMSELLIGLIGCLFLYWLGNILYPEPEHKPIQQELIKMESNKDGED